MVLAGGRSSRMKTLKGLLSFENRPWLYHQYEQYGSVGGRQILTVLGHQAGEYFKAIPLLEESLGSWKVLGKTLLCTLLNQNPEKGPFSSLLTAADWLTTRSYPGLFLLPIDVPCPGEDFWEAMVAMVQENPETKAFIPSYQGNAGHPVYLSSDFLNDLLGLCPDANDSRLDYQIRRLPHNEVRRFEVQDARVAMNFNTPEQWISAAVELGSKRP